MTPDGPRDRRTRQLALVAICLLGLVVAAFAAPTISANGPGVAPPPGGGGGGGGAGDGGGGAGIEDLVRWLFSEDSSGRDPDGTPVTDDREIDRSDDRVTRTPPDEDTCAVRFLEDPLPGEHVTVAVNRGRDEIENARVFLNGEYVGSTNTYGRVEVQVPYERRLVLNARLPSDVACIRVAQADDRDRVDVARLGHSPGTSVTADTARQVDDDNVSNAYSVDAEVNLTVEGRPIPGETVELTARVGDAPMRESTVTVDGEEVGRTDTRGEYDLSLPADGRRAITVEVSRGDFEGTTRVQLARLSASLNPNTVVAIPGGETTLRATLGDQPVSGAVVRDDGRTLGETNAQGETTFALPSDPTATVTVEAAGQQVTKSVLPLYAGTAILAVLAVVALVLGVAVVVFGVAWLVRVARWLARAALRLAIALEGSLGWLRTQLGRLRRWLATLLSTGRASTPTLLSRLASWLLDLPGRVLAGLLAVLGWLRRAPLRLWRWLWSWRRDGDDGADTDADGTADDPAGGRAVVDAGPTSLRERWRAFARWVSPRDWRQRTPGEVARDAVANGFPDESVETLTEVFRDVEYGNVPLSTERREQAREAFESLAGHRRDTANQPDRQTGPPRTDGSGPRSGTDGADGAGVCDR